MLIDIEPGLVQTRLVPVWVWGGSRPLVFFRWCPDWMPPILNKWTCLRQVSGRFWESWKKSPGKEACESSGTAWEVGSPLRALQIPEQACEPPPKADIRWQRGLKKASAYSQQPAGLTAQPTAGCGTGSSVARRRVWAPELPRLPASTRSVCSTAPG